MGFTALATKFYKDPVTVVWANSIQANDDYLYTGACKAYVSFDGSAAALSARAHQNISSLGDDGVGRFTLNFITGMANTGFAVFGTVDFTGAGGAFLALQSATTPPLTTSTARINCHNDGGSLQDHTYVTVAIIGQSN